MMLAIIQFSSLLMLAGPHSTQNMQWLVACCPLYSPWNETTDSTFQGDQERDM